MTLKETVDNNCKRIACPDWTPGFSIILHGYYWYKMPYYTSVFNNDYSNRYIFSVEDIVADDWYSYEENMS